jgi:suppressor of ftsI
LAACLLAAAAAGSSLIAGAKPGKPGGSSIPSGKGQSNCPRHPPPFIHDSFPQPEFRYSHNGVLRTSLTAATVPTQVNGQTLTRSVYDGEFPGPTLVFCPGDTVNVQVRNFLDPANFSGHHAGWTNLHTHGLHVTPQKRGDNVFVKIPPESSFGYRYEIPANHRPGAYWYHPHLHGQSNAQVGSATGGMAGAMIVQGGLDNRPAYQDIGQRVLVIQKTALSDGGPRQYVTNGALNPEIPIQPGEIQRWSIFNATAVFFVKLQLEGQSFQLLARDGNYLERRTSRKTMLIPPGSRREVLVTGGPAGSSARLLYLPFPQFPDDDPVEETLGTVVSQGPAVNQAMPPHRITRYEDLRDHKVDATHDLVYTQNDDTEEFFINGQMFDPRRIDEVMHLGEVNRWTIRNHSDEWHTFHIHIQDFQVVNINGRPVKGVYDADNIEIKPHGSVTLLTRPTDYTGKYVFHCHVLFHEDHGMMGTVRVRR